MHPKRKFKGKKHYHQNPTHFHSKRVGNLGVGSTTNKVSSIGPGKKIIGNPIPYGKLGNAEYRFYSQSELYLMTTCYCEKCTDYLASLGVNIKTIPEKYGNILLELKNDERPLVYDFLPRGSTPKPIAKGIIQILRALMADKKGPWTTKPFMFLGKLVRPGHWQVEHFDRLSRVEQDRVGNTKTIESKSPYDNKLDFENKAQMNAEFEKRFSQ